jgi:hypothetical protein
VTRGDVRPVIVSDQIAELRSSTVNVTMPGREGAAIPARGRSV